MKIMMTSRPRESRRSARRLAGWLTFFFLTATAIVVARLVLPCLSDPSSDFEARRGKLVDVQQTAEWRWSDTILTELTLVSSSGLEVDITVRAPAALHPPSPLVILLGGHRTGRDAARLVTDIRGIVLAALSYPYRGDPEARGPSLLMDIPKIQRAIRDTTPAVLLTLDYLMERPDVDPERVELVGVSLGAFLVSVAAASEPRIGRVWLVHGAGEPADVLAHRLQGRVPFQLLRHGAGRILAWLAFSHYLRPEIWVGRIAPRSVVAVNARDDEQLPASSIEALHRSLREPFEILWTEGRHVGPDRENVVDQITALILDRLSRE